LRPDDAQRIDWLLAAPLQPLETRRWLAAHDRKTTGLHRILFNPFSNLIKKSILGLRVRRMPNYLIGNDLGRADLF